MDGERTIAVKTRPRKRAEPSRSAAEVAPAATEMRTAATEMRPAAEMPAAMAATVKMPSTAVTATVAPAAMTTAVATSTVAPAATFRSSITRGRQYGRQSNDRNSNLEF